MAGPTGRRLLAHFATNPTVRRAVVSVPGIRAIAWRFVAGETLDKAIMAARAVHASGMATTINHVGTHVRDEAEANAATDDIRALLRRLHASRVPSHVSVKLTQIGLDVNYDLCRANFARILELSVEHGIFIRIDMEESPYVERTLILFEEARARYGVDSVGIVLQSYLRHRRDDLKRLAVDHSSIRIVKGGYWESSDIVFREASEIDAVYLSDIATLLRIGHRPAIATHDERMIQSTRTLAIQAGRSPDAFEFQMLYGVQARLARELVRDGYLVRLYLPYGQEWYAYVLGCARRAARDMVRRLARRHPARARNPLKPQRHPKL